jgi:hypothetical protein
MLIVDAIVENLTYYISLLVTYQRPS